MKIKEDGYKVVIDNFVFEGQVEQDNFCSNCKFNLVYYDDFDTYFCPKCNSWIDQSVVTQNANTALNDQKNLYPTNSVTTITIEY